jgi:glycogen debranching enzyme
MSNNEAITQGYDKALELLHACATEHGFVASPSGHQNYHRIWGRDSVIMALAALMSQDPSLIETARRSLETLAQHQGPHGEIPSNVEPASNRVSYGGTTGRVDADIWFIIGCAEYWCATGDDNFLEGVLPALEKARFLLGAWEFNSRGLIYVPLTGDWADEYLHNGYVLYDQLLYLQAQRSLARIHRTLHDSVDHDLLEKISRLRHLIRTNYWFNDGEGLPDDAYHEVLYEKGRKAACHCAGLHWLPSFSPTGYGYRFDTLANVLASLLDVADDDQRRRVDDFIDNNLIDNKQHLLPAFHPVIQPVDEDWQELQVMFSYTFKNKPYEFHNGGRWPMVTGFYVADLAKRGRSEEAQTYLNALHRANALPMEGEPWGFPEYVHGQSGRPEGTRQQGWSAAAAVIGHHAIQGEALFRIDDHGA